MHIWIDADACPQTIKAILYRAALRTETHITLVSGQSIATPPSAYITKLQVITGPDAADNKIIERVQPGDLVITADVPLADAVVSKGCTVLNPRGTIYTEQNVKERLAVRNLSDELRGSGVRTGGPAMLSKQEVQTFSNHLDRLLSKS